MLREGSEGEWIEERCVGLWEGDHDISMNWAMVSVLKTRYGMK